VTDKDLRYHEKIDPKEMPELDPKHRIKGFDEVEEGFAASDADVESSRCLECGCEALFECKLREYATEYGIEVDKVKGEANTYELDRSHPLIEVDPNKCILCARCIRVCSDVVGASVFGFETRGFSTIVRPEMGSPMKDTQCISCGMCIATCPTGAISTRYQLPKPGPWALKSARSTCTYCGVGCSMELGYLADRHVKVMADKGPSLTHGNLCLMGRFGSSFVHDPKRLTQPAAKSNGNLKYITWEKAIPLMAERTKEIVQKYRGNEIGVFISPRLTNEEIYLIQKFARVVLKTHNITSVTFQNDQIKSLDIQSDASIEDIETADTVIVTLTNLRKDHTVVDFMVRKARSAGASVVYIGPESDDYLKKSDIYLQSKPGSEAAVVQGIMKGIVAKQDGQRLAELGLGDIKQPLEKLSEKEIESRTGISWQDIQRTSELLLESAKPVFIADRNAAGSRHPKDLQLIQVLSDLSGGKLALYTEQNNTQGLMDIAGEPNLYPGYQDMADKTIEDCFEKGWCVSLSEMYNHRTIYTEI